MDMRSRKMLVLLLLSVLLGLSSQVRLGHLDVRLVGRHGEGRLEARRFSNESWSSVVSSEWGPPATAVVCRQLDTAWKWGKRYYLSDKADSETVYLRGVQCAGNETDLGQCHSNPWGPSHGIQHSQVIALRCHKYTVRLRAQLPRSSARLNVYVHSQYGAVEVLRTSDYSWLPVTSTGWDDKDARVICRSYGYTDGKALCCQKLTRGLRARYYTIIDSLGCLGNETSYESCNYSLARDGHGKQAASAICYHQPWQNVDKSFDIRLNNVTGGWGRVEVRHMGVWGSVSAPGTWDDAAADVVCRQIKGQGGGIAFGYISSSKETFQGSSWVTELNCTGRESSLEQCVVPPWGKSVRDFWPRYAMCYPNSPPVIRLAGGSSANHGRVEVSLDGNAYTVCDTEWDNFAAHVVCKRLGYSSGQALQGSHYGKGTGPVGLDNVKCVGDEPNLFHCSSNGWLHSSPVCDQHNSDAAVFCHGDVRLTKGDHSTGILQVYNSDRDLFYTVCGTGFDDADATVACRSLGFEHGKALRTGAYGEYYYYYTMWRDLACNGSESSVYNCSHSDLDCYYGDNLNYAAVSCYNGTLNPTNSVSLVGNVEQHRGSSGHVQVRVGGLTGLICAESWDDKDARVVCRQLNYAHGVAYGLSPRAYGPYLLSGLDCQGTEASIFSCPRQNVTCEDYPRVQDAGAFCYNEEGPQIQLVGGKSDREGRVEIFFEGRSGTVCVPHAYDEDDTASAVCKSLGFATGKSTSNRPGSGRVALSVGCDYTDTSILACSNNGLFSTPPQTCADHSKDLTVVCKHNVELAKMPLDSANAIAGIVHVFWEDWWNYACYNMSPSTARVVCRQLGFPHYAVLPRGALGKLQEDDLSSLRCNGDELSVLECDIEEQACSNDDDLSYAALVCSKTPVAQGLTALPPASQPGFVLVKKYGLKSTVCSASWDDKAAKVYCGELGYSFGMAWGSSQDGPTTVHFIYNVNCDGSEEAIAGCQYETGYSCENDDLARVFCYNSQEEFQVRLSGGAVPSEGNVEIGINGVWGAICDEANHSPAMTAKVVCRSLGYYGAKTDNRRPPSPQATIRFFFRDPNCDGDEDGITACSMPAYNGGTTDCAHHALAVECVEEVWLSPNQTYGAVHMLVNASSATYGLVCSDNFGNAEASVACRDLGFPHGTPLCCSAFGRLDTPIRRTNLHCTGEEAELKDCSYDLTAGDCPSGKYASVVCSNIPPNTGYAIDVETVQSYDYGRARVRYMGQQGYICPDNFTDQDANVICREAGYAGGVAFDYDRMNHDVKDIHWLSTLQCQGSESYLTQCSTVQWGNLTHCNLHAEAGVFCYHHSAPQFRLVNGSRYMGRLELWSDDVKGTVCGRYSSSYIAVVACRSMGFNYGRLLPNQMFGQGSADVLVDAVFCHGRESSLFRCFLRLKGFAGVACSSEHGGLAVHCYNTTRLTKTNIVNYGLVEVLSNRTWVAVCDQGFDGSAARVACRSMGYRESLAQCCSVFGPLYRRHYYRASAHTIGLVVNRCNGNEESLFDCDVSTTAACSSNKYVSAVCSNSSLAARRLQVRLKARSGEQRENLGAVQVNHYGFYGPVCNSSWDDRDANATCHGLGYNYGITFYGEDTSGRPVVAGKFQCTGLERSLADCSFTGMEHDTGCSGSVYRRKEAGAICFDTPGSGIRLVNGSRRHGRVEVMFQGQWRRVTGQRWYTSNARVACRQLGFMDGSPVYYRRRVHHPDRYSKIWLGNVGCDGYEKSLFECRASFDFQSNYPYDANVVCSNKVRIQRGDRISIGRLDVNINGRWGGVCDDKWTSRNTEVACNNLGYDNGFSVCCGTFGNPSGVLMETVSCGASDTDLTACSHNIPTKTDCLASAAAVACYNGSKPTAYTYRMNSHSEYSNSSGYIQVNFMNVTGGICSDGWDTTDAKVFCSELGFEHGIPYDHFSGSAGPFWMSNINCQGTESRLRDCPHDLGNVSECRSSNYAGVTCTNSEGIFYRLRGADSDQRGRVEVSVGGVWGALCGFHFYDAEANVLCRNLGFKHGKSNLYHKRYPDPPSRVYYSNLFCRGGEKELNECPHQGWTIEHENHRHCSAGLYAKVVCFGNVRIRASYSRVGKQGPVTYYSISTWNYICDSGFDDVTAKRVCQDLNYADGKAVLSSGFGSAYDVKLNFTMHCNGGESAADQCVRRESCPTDTYASVVCFYEGDPIESTGYSFDFENTTHYSGLVGVKHKNVSGNICGTGWNDKAARVFCRMKGFRNGLALLSSQKVGDSYESHGPNWLGNFNCTGNESRLQDCAFKDRLHIKCNTTAHAAAVCINGTGFQYRLGRLNGTAPNEGRVEMSLGDEWGTVCRYSWGDPDARVFCRSLHYHDGYAIRDPSHSGGGSGPIWMSYLKCKGSESSLHRCPHEKFGIRPAEHRWQYGCRSHKNDAYVWCVSDLKLSLGYNASMGAVLLYRKNTWNLICDTAFDATAATVVCRQLGFGFGLKISGSKFGRIGEATISITNVRCTGSETKLSECNFDISTGCRTRSYASVFCSDKPLQEEQPNVRLEADSTAQRQQGYVEMQVDGVWGAVCGSTWDDKAATVVCRQLGHQGGVPYRPPSTQYHAPILTSDRKCQGTESGLDACPRVTLPASAWCDYYAPRAGVLCYNGSETVSYRITGDESVKSRGRFEMKYMGQYGASCSYWNNKHSARVACRSVGYVDGLPISGIRFPLGRDEPVFFYTMSCVGNETSVALCDTSGFNLTYKGYMHSMVSYMCRTHYGPFSVNCYSSKLDITNLRLVGGESNSSGRVEVYLEGPDQWGTVCDDLWDNRDATVVCRQLGFATGTAVSRAGFGQGKGHIWMDNLGCNGSESRIQDCVHNGYGIHNCRHTEDAGVICSGVKVPTTTTAQPTTAPSTLSTAQPTGGATKATAGTKSPQATAQPSTGGDNASSAATTAAVVVPIVLVILLAIAVAVGVVVYRRRQNPGNLHMLTEDGAVQSGSLTFGRGGVVKFINTLTQRGRKNKAAGTPGDLPHKEPGSGDGGISNPVYDVPVDVHAVGGSTEAEYKA